MAEQRYTFESTASEDGNPVEYAHSGQECAIVRRLTNDEADLNETGPMFEVKFDDGVTVHVFEDELTAIGWNRQYREAVDLRRSVANNQK